MKYKSVPFLKDEHYPRDALISTLKEFRTEHITFSVEGDNIRVSELKSELPNEEPVVAPTIPTTEETPTIEETPKAPKKVSVSSGGLKLAMASIFRMKGKPVLSEQEIVNAMAFDTKWVGPSRARDIIFTAREMGILKETPDGLEPGFDLDTMPENAFNVSFDFLKKDSPSKEEPKSVVDLQKVEKQPAGLQENTPPAAQTDDKPKKVLPAWSKQKLNNDKCLKHCKNKNTACNDCWRWSNFKDNP